MSLFSRDARQTSAPRSSGPNVIEARRKLQSWGACGETGERFGEREIFLLILSKGVGSGHSLTSSGLAVSKLLASQRASPAYSSHLYLYSAINN